MIARRWAGVAVRDLRPTSSTSPPAVKIRRTTESQHSAPIADASTSMPSAVTPHPNGNDVGRLGQPSRRGPPIPSIVRIGVIDHGPDTTNRVRQ